MTTKTCMNKDCPNYGKPLVSGNFCGHCGDKLIDMPRCRHCNEEIWPNTNFCIRCGRPNK